MKEKQEREITKLNLEIILFLCNIGIFSIVCNFRVNR